MASQLLFGELVEVLESKGKQWSRVRCENDNFVGWIESNQLKAITPSEFDRFKAYFAFSLELVQPVMGDDHFIPITMGARLPDFDGIHFKLGEMQFTFSGQAIAPSEFQPSIPFILKIAKRYLNTPFLWGGRSPFGIDSGGLVQMVYSFGGIQLPREPDQQIKTGTTVDFVQHAGPGDLAFFENKNGRINHVGIIMDDQRIIHAFGGVRIDLIDHYGIYDEVEKKYTHRLRLAKRILPKQKTEEKTGSVSADNISRQVELF